MRTRNSLQRRGAFFIILMLFALLFVTACDGNGSSVIDNGDDDRESSTDGDSINPLCSTDPDCDVGYICVGGVCLVNDGTACPESAECCADVQCGTNEYCDDNFVCSPMFPDGDSDSDDIVDGDTTTCDCNNNPCISIDPPSLSFGAVMINDSGVQSFNIQNDGFKTLQILDMVISQASDTDYSWQGGAPSLPIDIAPGQFETFNILLSPSDPGRNLGTIELVTNDPCIGYTTEIQLTSDYKGETEIVIAPDPPEYDFGVVEVGATEIPLQITVTNVVPTGQELDSNKALTVGPITLEPAQSAHFRLQENLPQLTHINPGDSMAFLVYYKPASQGVHDAVIKINHNADHSRYEPKNPVNFTLTGTGVVPCLTIDPNPVDFGDVTINQEVNTEVELESSCGGTVRIESIQWTNPVPDPNLLWIDTRGIGENHPIAPNDYATFRVFCKPESVVPLAGVIEVRSNDVNEPIQLLPVQCIGVQSVIVVEPTTLNFEEVLLNDVGEEGFTVQNRGTGDLIITSLNVENPSEDPNAFYVDPEVVTQLPLILSLQDDPREILMFFKPTYQEEGYVHVGKLTITTNNPTYPEYEIPLRGEGVWPWCTFNLVDPSDGSSREIFDEDLISFEEVNLETSKVLRLRVVNEGSYKCKVSNLTLGPGSSTEFSFFPQLIPDIQPGGFANIDLSYSPVGWPGEDTGSFRINTNDFRDDHSYAEFDLYGLGVNPSIEVTPLCVESNPCDLGEIFINSCSDPYLVTITNDGVGTLEVYGYSIYRTTGPPENWEIEGWPQMPAYLRNYNDHNEDKIEFTVTFCPHDYDFEQELVLRVESNDNNNSIMYVAFKAEGVNCDEDWYTIDPAQPCGYYCHRPQPENQVPYEICDGFDNDCDGLTDEDFLVGRPCNGTGECGWGEWECSGLDPFSVICSTEPGGSAPQTQPDLCDGLDNDCDGEVDEDFSIGEICLGEGECGLGEWRCMPNDPYSRYCNANDNGGPEICDGYDNDCDGTVDNGEFFIYGSGEPPGTCVGCLGNPCTGTGGCGNGSQYNGYFQCLNGNAHQEIVAPELWIQCSADPGGDSFTGGVEVCNNEDDDCDGNTDEDFDIGVQCNGVGQCGIGVKQCDPQNYLTTICSTDRNGDDYVYVPESCDGLDNDCDGETDEDFFIGSECLGVGECGTGEWECAPGGQGRICSVNSGGSNYQGTAELCDNLDNDCDGETDENWDVGLPCVGQGVCGLGVKECADVNSWRCSTDFGGSQYGGTSERCDSLDNDCDGQTDEDYYIGLPCVGQGECGSGIYECKNLSANRCSTDYGGSQYGGTSESCDSLDNDCDGSTDEDFNVGNNCDGVGECGPGVIECASSSSSRCSTDLFGSEYDGSPEICDNLDNDCDGVRDEDFCTDCDDINNCGGCGVVCTVANGTPICDQGECKISSCSTYYHDLNGEYDDGCECLEDQNDQDGQGNTCNNAAQSEPYRLTDNNGQLAVVSGTIAPESDVDWFTFMAIDGPESGANRCDEFNAEVKLTNNPNGQFAFDVYRGGCPSQYSADVCDGTGTPGVARGVTNYNFATDSQWPPTTVSDPSWGRGQCPCNAPASSATGVNDCEEQNFTFYVKVYRSGSTVTCGTYELQVSNGVASTP